MRVVAIYPRVSTGEQSPEPQLRELREYAGRRRFAVHREYGDQASGDVGQRKHAPAFDELMADARCRRCKAAPTAAVRAAQARGRSAAAV